VITLWFDFNSWAIAAPQSQRTKIVLQETNRKDERNYAMTDRVGVPSGGRGGAAALDVQTAHKLMGLRSALKPKKESNENFTLRVACF
jgi:hypothetical protein